jgi:hypothetical protein
VRDPGAAENALGHWYANVVSINRSAFVLAISERSLLSVVLPGPPFESLPVRFPEALSQLLRSLAVPEIQVAREQSLTAPLTIAATANRQVLGCLNQYAFELSMHCEDHPGATLLERELWLSENISSAIRYNAPRELALDLLAARGN